MGNVIFNFKYYYKYDEKGQQVEGSPIMEWNFLFKHTFKYDDNGNKTNGYK
jgi:hypothetical protein